MEWIFIGVAIAIGFYLAPIIISLIVLAFILVGHAIASVFRFLFGGAR